MPSTNKYRYGNSKLFNVPVEYMNPKFWIDRMTGPNGIILTHEQIEEYNNMNYELPLTEMADLLNMEPLVEGHRLMAQLCSHPIPEETRYSFGRAVNDNFYWPIVDRLNLYDIEHKKGLGYGIVIDNAPLRTFPTAYESLRSPEEQDLDRFAESLLKIWEPVVVLHSDNEGEWLYVQTRNYRGWVDSDYVALVDDREQWKALVDPEDFLVVTGDIHLPYNPYNTVVSELYLPMGTKLPLVSPQRAPKMIDEMSVAGSLVISLPGRDNAGMYKEIQTLISPSADVHSGYLPYTAANIVQQGFKLLGGRYGWGGMYYGRDCSGLVCDIYSSFGIHLPRNCKQQREAMGEDTWFTNKGESQRKGLLRSLKPCSLLYFPGHVMMYLGELAGRHYVLHSVYSLGKTNSRLKVEEEKIASVVISDLNHLRANGKSLFESIEIGKSIRIRS